MAIDDKTQEEYDERFSETDKEHLRRSKIHPEIANRFEKIDGETIRRFYSELTEKMKGNDDGLYTVLLTMIDIINNITKSMTPEEIEEKFNDAGKEPMDYRWREYTEQEKHYLPEFENDDLAICGFLAANVSPEDAKMYPRAYAGKEMAYLRKNSIPPDDMTKYTQRFLDLDLSEAEKFEFHRFHYFKAYEVAILEKAGCPIETTREYDRTFFSIFNRKKIFGAEVFGILHSIGITPEDIKAMVLKKQEESKRTFDNILNLLEQEQLSQFSLLGTGNSALVLLTMNNFALGSNYHHHCSAWKFSKDAEYEYGLLRRLERHHGILNNVIMLESGLNDKLFFRLSFVPGASLEQKINDEAPFESETVARYSAHILNGLIEMREAGIYQHKDIRPANIMIDEEMDKAVIIDLGIASTEKQPKPKHNRRYGGPNDLVSLGQVMYKMATGDHLFAKSKSMERASRADRLKDHRDWVYEKDKRIDRYCRKVRADISDPQISEAITFCLKADVTDEDYTQLREMLER
ncbi:MAG: hypothetical protein V1729_04500 [Candidatus Woesearchaeota archaeon]